MSAPLIELAGVTRRYDLGDAEPVIALRGVDLAIDDGEFVSIVGPSGSGKSTMLHLLGALDKPSEGTVSVAGRDVSQMGDAELAELRNATIGFVFQQFHLLARTPAVANVELPLVYAGVSRGERRRRAGEALAQVGLGHRLEHKPNQLSGGEQQRVAIARALVTRPRLLLADEPTGNLDTQRGEEVMALLADLNAKEGVAVVVITHDLEIAALAPRQIGIRDGVVSEPAVLR
ncbi:MAG: ABC transporter ATP-binding protein [Egibacteraceae bacterium]